MARVAIVTRVTSARILVRPLIVVASLLAVGLGWIAFGHAQGTDPCTFPGGDNDRVEAFLQAGCYSGWVHDSEVRRTGPIIEGVDFFTHGRARVYYSPEVVDWLESGRPEGGLGDHAIIVKENWPPLPETDPPDPATLFWTTMVRVPEGSFDGWFWQTSQASKPGSGRGSFG